MSRKKLSKKELEKLTKENPKDNNKETPKDNKILKFFSNRKNVVLTGLILLLTASIATPLIVALNKKPQKPKEDAEVVIVDGDNKSKSPETIEETIRERKVNKPHRRQPKETIARETSKETQKETKKETVAETSRETKKETPKETEEEIIEVTPRKETQTKDKEQPRKEVKETASKPVAKAKTKRVIKHPAQYKKVWVEPEYEYIKHPAKVEKVKEEKCYIGKKYSNGENISHLTHEQILKYNERCLLEEWNLPQGCGWTSAQFCDEVWTEKVTKEAWTEKKVVKEGYYKSELVKEAWEETVWE